MHKPSGVLTTRRDPQGRPTVFDLVPEIPGLTYVGRLDYMTEGVLLMTTDGDAAHRLTHPSREVERTYVATVRGNANAAMRAARKGVELEDGLVQPVSVDARPLGDRRWEFEITIERGPHARGAPRCARRSTSRSSGWSVSASAPCASARSSRAGCAR